MGKLYLTGQRLTPAPAAGQVSTLSWALPCPARLLCPWPLPTLYVVIPVAEHPHLSSCLQVLLATAEDG